MDMDLAKFLGAMDPRQMMALLDYILPKASANSEIIVIAMRNDNPQIDVGESGLIASDSPDRVG